jgi:hypothetical protein
MNERGASSQSLPAGIPNPTGATAASVSFPGPLAKPGQWVIAFVILGVVIRLVRYLLCFPLTGDEARLASNFVDTTYAQLTQTTRFNTVAPVPFNWIELFNTRLLGYSEYSLRLVPLICNLASLALFVHVGRRIVAGATWVLTVAVFAVSYVLLRYSTEVKPYSLDLLVSLTLIALIVEWQRAPSRVSWLWGLTAFTPVALAVSFPAVFVAGAIGFTFAAPVWKTRNQRARWVFFGFLCILAATFLVNLRFVIGAQYHGVQQHMMKAWEDSFPPMSHPLRIPFWLLRTFTGPLMPYPVGGSPPLSLFGLILFVVGLYSLWCNQRKWLVTLTLTMLALGLAAAAMRRYPFGHAPRIVLYLAPVICLAVGSGIAQSISWLRKASWRAQALGWTMYLLCFGIGFSDLILEVVKPNKGIGTEIHRGFAKWFWIERPDLQTVCVDLDMHRQLYSEFPSSTYLEPAYPCYRAMYDPWFKRATVTVRNRRTGCSGGLRCVFIHMEDAQRNDAAFDAWMSEMLTHYELTEHCTYRLPMVSGTIIEHGVYEAYLFAPRGVAEEPHTGQ